MAEFGYHTIGAITNKTHGASAIYVGSHTYSPAQDGVIDSIFVYCKSGGTIQTKVAMYDAADDSLVAESEEIDVTTTWGWFEAAVVGEVDVFAAKSYYFAFKQSDLRVIALDTGTIDRRYAYAAYANDWPDPGDWTTQPSAPYQYSVYAEYTPGAPPSQTALDYERKTRGVARGVARGAV